MVANPFNRGSPKRANPNPSPVRPNRPTDPTRRRGLPRVEPLRPPRPSRPAPLFPGTPRRPAVPFGRPAIQPVPALMPWKLARFGLRALPWLNLALTAWDIYQLYKQWNPDPNADYLWCRDETGKPIVYRWMPGMWGCSGVSWQPEPNVWTPATPSLVKFEKQTPVDWIWYAMERWYYEGPPDDNIPLPEEGLPEPVIAPMPPLEVPFPFPFAPMPTPNIPFPLTRPGQEHGPGIRPRPDSPLPPEVLPPAMPPGEPGPGFSPEPGAPVRPTQPIKPPAHWPTPVNPFPGFPPVPNIPAWPVAPSAPGGDGIMQPGVPVTPSPALTLDPLAPGGFIPGAVAPQPDWHFHLPPDRDKERKRKFTASGTREWMAFLEKVGGSYMEVDDYVAALYKGIPWKYRRWRGRDGVWRDRDITSADRAFRIGQYFDQYNISAGLKELAQMYLTDKAFGKVGQALKNKTRELGNEGIWGGARGAGAGVPLNRQDEEARKKLVRERYEANKKDRFYWKTEYWETGGYLRRKVSRPDTEIPWFRRGTRHRGSGATGQSYDRRGRGNSYYSSNRG